VLSSPRAWCCLVEHLAGVAGLLCDPCGGKADWLMVRAGLRPRTVLDRLGAVKPEDVQVAAGLIRRQRPVAVPPGLADHQPEPDRLQRRHVVLLARGVGHRQVDVDDGLGRQSRDRSGAFAEYIAVDQGSLAAKPGNLTFEQAAAVPLAAVTALQGLRTGGIQPGQRVLIIGASGGVGTFAVQIARHLKARVTGVCSAGHVDLVRRLGAGHVIDYSKQDFTSAAVRYDLALQLGGTYSPAAR
jgi:threonine dehydrogenase-like Zn-dependent dehydrogenase